MASTPYRQPGRRRSKAWVYYAAIAVLAVIGGIVTQSPSALLPAVLCAAYSVYIYRGGRFVFWIW